MSIRLFDLLHCDIWGPYHIPSHSGHKYFFTLVDDCSRFTCIYLLRQKFDAVTVIPHFFNMVTTRFNATINTFRSNNAPELSFKDYFVEKGVLHQFSCVERPQQNFIVERKHQHLLNMARTLFFQTRIPIHFWTECVMTARYLINRTPSPILKHKTPYEILYGVPADYSTLRVFGCLRFASTLTTHRDKFQPRAKLCVFFGYPSGIKGYKLFDVETKRIFISRDVIFHEENFPSHTIVKDDQLLDPFPDLVLPSASLVSPHDDHV